MRTLDLGDALTGPCCCRPRLRRSRRAGSRRGRRSRLGRSQLGLLLLDVRLEPPQQEGAQDLAGGGARAGGDGHGGGRGGRVSWEVQRGSAWRGRVWHVAALAQTWCSLLTTPCSVSPLIARNTLKWSLSKIVGEIKCSSDQSSVGSFCNGVPLSSSRTHGCSGLTSQMALSALTSLQFMFLSRWSEQATVEGGEFIECRGRGGPRLRHMVWGELRRREGVVRAHPR